MEKIWLLNGSKTTGCWLDRFFFLEQLNKHMVGQFFFVEQEHYGGPYFIKRYWHRTIIVQVEVEHTRYTKTEDGSGGRRREVEPGRRHNAGNRWRQGDRPRDRGGAGRVLCSGAHVRSQHVGPEECRWGWAEMGLRVTVSVCNVVRADQAKLIMDTVKATFDGKLDILVS